jgi:hypothetical protein
VINDKVYILIEEDWGYSIIRGIWLNKENAIAQACAEITAGLEVREYPLNQRVEPGAKCVVVWEALGSKEASNVQE